MAIFTILTDHWIFCHEESPVIQAIQKAVKVVKMFSGSRGVKHEIDEDEESIFTIFTTQAMHVKYISALEQDRI